MNKREQYTRLTKEINIVIVLITLTAGILNFFFLGLAIAFTSGEPEITINKIIGQLCFWTSLVHVTISSWLFIYKKIAGRILAILSSLIGVIGPVMIMTSGITFLWLTISVCFVATALFHIVG